MVPSLRSGKSNASLQRGESKKMFERFDDDERRRRKKKTTLKKNNDFVVADANGIIGFCVVSMSWFLL